MSVISLSSLEQALGYTFKDPALLQTALIHRSYLNPKHKKATSSATHKSTSNERLEFLGDRVLGLVLASYLYSLCDYVQEDILASSTAYLGSSEVLKDVAKDLSLAKYIKVSGVEGEASLSKIHANAVEAILGAIYLESGISVVRPVIIELWKNHISKLATPELSMTFNPKSMLQEWLQKNSLPLPTYTELSRTGDAHNPVFTVELHIEGFKKVQSSAKSKRKAEKEVALQFLQQNKITPHSKLNNCPVMGSYRKAVLNHSSSPHNNQEPK